MQVIMQVNTDLTSFLAAVVEQYLHPISPYCCCCCTRDLRDVLCFWCWLFLIHTKLQGREVWGGQYANQWLSSRSCRRCICGLNQAWTQHGYHFRKRSKLFIEVCAILLRFSANLCKFPCKFIKLKSRILDELMSPQGLAQTQLYEVCANKL